MGDVAVQKRPTPSPFSDPAYSSTLDSALVADNNDYAKLKRLQRHLE